MKRLASMFLGVSIFASPVMAAEHGNTPLSQDSSVYGRVGAGVLSVNDIDFNSTASGYGVTVTAAGTFSFDTGYSVSGAVGYNFNDNIAVELELGYAAAEYDQVSGNLNATSGATTYTVSGSANVDGSVSMFTGLGNLILSAGNKNGFNPYIGGGLGILKLTDKIDKVGTLNVNGEETSTNLAANGILGFDYALQDGVEAGLRYRYFWADTGQNGIDDATAHNLMATIKFAF